MNELVPTTETSPSPQEKRIELLEQALRTANQVNRDLRQDNNDVRAVVAHQALEIRGYIEQDIVAGKKWRDRAEATAVELRLLNKTGLHSGCGCPIGVCLYKGSTALNGACWVEWAEGFVLKRRGEVRIDELRTQASHPARVAAAQRERTPTDAAPEQLPPGSA